MVLVKKIKRYFFTIKDIGYKKFCLILIYRIKQFRFSLIPINFSYLIFKKLKVIKTPFFESKNGEFEEFFLSLDQSDEKLVLDFILLNKKSKLVSPLNWHESKFGKLWIFNLNYFVWAREILNDYCKSKTWDDKATYLGKIIDDWIAQNKYKINISWHSFPTSLRTRNWIIIFRFCPNLINKNRINSLWDQILWLTNNKEKHLGGNHYLDNLFALIIGSLHFKNYKSENIFKESIRLLKIELKNQILFDGGHEERCALYHINLLEGLVEVACFMNIFQKKVPNWMSDSIYLMLKWAKLNRLNNGLFPRFNDSPLNDIEKVEDIINFAEGFLSNKVTSLKNLNGFILKASIKENKKNKENKEIEFDEMQNKIINSKYTGWTILKPNKDWELVFKCGTPCPKDLPAHVHSDQLSFDLYFKGNPIIAEVGTSSYQDLNIRGYERSSAAHNVFQLSKTFNKNDESDLEWIETVDVWDKFRAAFKCESSDLHFGETSDNFLYVGGSHDAYKRYNAKYKKLIKCRVSEEIFEIHFEDKIFIEKGMFWRRFWHLGPYISRELESSIFNQIKNSAANSSEIDSWYSEGFGIKKPSKTIISRGFLEKGHHTFKTKILFPNAILP